MLNRKSKNKIEYRKIDGFREIKDMIERTKIKKGKCILYIDI